MAYWNVILFAVVPDHSHGKFLTDPFPALVPDPADGKTMEKILTSTVPVDTKPKRTSTY